MKAELSHYYCQKLHNIFEDFSLFLRNKIVE